MEVIVTVSTVPDVVEPEFKPAEKLDCTLISLMKNICGNENSAKPITAVAVLTIG